MLQYLKELEKFKDIKEIKDIVDDANKLAELYYNNNFNEMYQHIDTIMKKHLFETIEWNAVNKNMPQTPEQHFINTNVFLKEQSIKKLYEKFKEVSKEKSGENK